MPRWLGPVLVALSLIVAAAARRSGPGTGVRAPASATSCVSRRPRNWVRQRRLDRRHEMTCTQATCTPASGEVQVAIRRADGRVEQSAWAGRAPAERPPASRGPCRRSRHPRFRRASPPRALGVPEPTCGEQASSALMSWRPAGASWRSSSAARPRATPAPAGHHDAHAGRGSTTRSDWAYQAVGGATERPSPTRRPRRPDQGAPASSDTIPRTRTRIRSRGCWGARGRPPGGRGRARPRARPTWSPPSHDQHRRAAQGRGHRARQRPLADPRLPPHQDGPRVGAGAHHAPQRQARPDGRAQLPGRHEVAARRRSTASRPVPVPRRRRLPLHGQRHLRPVQPHGGAARRRGRTTSRTA